MPRRPLTKRRRLILRWGIASALLVVLMGGVALFWEPSDPAALDASGEVEGLTSVLSREITKDMVTFRFEDVTESAGITFHHFQDARRSLLPEDMGSGLAWGDYDDDGDPDLFLANFKGSILGDDTGGAAPALYRNDGGIFSEVTDDAGVGRPVFGMGATWADYDDDGDIDLYLTNYGPNVLYRNEGDGTFVDVTDAAGVGDPAFGAGSAWGDYDNDGDIDLYVANYVDFVYRQEDQALVSRQYGSEMPFTLNPSTYSASANRLYRNNGNGTFTDVAPGTPVANPAGRSLGAVWFDFDLDGLMDLYVANDVSENGVYHNRGDGTFVDIGPSSLAADYRGAMGLAVADYDQDGDFDLFVTHWLAQENAFFENMHVENWPDGEGRRRLFFMDSAEMIGLGQSSLRMVGWSTGFADFDNDGLLDLWVVNGNTLEVADDSGRLVPQVMQLYRQQQDKGFFEIGRYASETFSTPLVGRGGAHADFDGDGRLDIAVVDHGGPVLLLRNTSENEHNWLGVQLRQAGGNTRALGAVVTANSGAATQMVQVGADGAYLSQHDGTIYFGLGSASVVAELTVTWPDGHVDSYTDVRANQVVSYEHVPEYPAQRTQ